MRNIITKLTSRKFLFAVAVFIVALTGVNDSTISIIMVTVTAVAYMFSEAIVDKARAIKRIMNDTATVTKVFDNIGENNDVVEQ